MGFRSMQEKLENLCNPISKDTFSSVYESLEFSKLEKNYQWYKNV